MEPKTPPTTGAGEGLEVAATPADAVVSAEMAVVVASREADVREDVNPPPLFKMVKTGVVDEEKGNEDETSL
jgi:hypothetical protein